MRPRLTRWVYLGDDLVVNVQDVIAVVNWTVAKDSPHMKEFLGFVRAHDSLVEKGKDPKRTMLIETERVFLLNASSRKVRQRLASLIP